MSAQRAGLYLERRRKHVRDACRRELRLASASLDDLCDRCVDRWHGKCLARLHAHGYFRAARRHACRRIRTAARSSQQQDGKSLYLHIHLFCLLLPWIEVYPWCMGLFAPAANSIKEKAGRTNNYCAKNIRNKNATAMLPCTYLRNAAKPLMQAQPEGRQCRAWRGRSSRPRGTRAERRRAKAPRSPSCAPVQGLPWATCRT